VIARDQAYFKLAFFSGDRPGDMRQIKVPEILRFPNDDGFLLNHIWGKTLRDGDGNVFGVRRNAQVEICPIHTAYIKATHIRSVHMNKLSLWLNCRTARGSCRYGTNLVPRVFSQAREKALETRLVRDDWCLRGGPGIQC